MGAANKAKYRINEKYLPPKYQYEFFDKENLNSDKKRFSAVFPNVMFIFELLIAGCVVLMMYL